MTTSTDGNRVFASVAFGTLYTLMVCVLGAISSFDCYGRDNTCAGTDRIVTDPVFMVALALPLLVLAFLNVIWYHRKDDGKKND